MPLIVHAAVMLWRWRWQAVFPLNDMIGDPW